MGININSFSQNHRIICTKCLNTSTFVHENRQRVFPAGRFLQWEAGAFSDFVPGGSLAALVWFVVQLCPPGWDRQKERSEAKLCWMILELPVFQKAAGKICGVSLKVSLEKAFNVSSLQQFPEDRINCSLGTPSLSAYRVVLHQYCIEILLMLQGETEKR